MLLLLLFKLLLLFVCRVFVLNGSVPGIDIDVGLCRRGLMPGDFSDNSGHLRG